MKYNISVDCGGSKIAGIVFDDNFLPISEFSVGSDRPNTTPPDVANANRLKFIELMKEAGVTSVGIITGACSVELTKLIESEFSIETDGHLSELILGLAGALIRPWESGTLLLSGTGSGVYTRFGDGRLCHTGGFGAAIGDPGSGYDIGRHAYNAAIADYEGRGEHTVLCDMIKASFGYSDLRNAIFGGIYNDRKNISPTAVVASASKLVSLAAEQGDNVSRGILAECGRSLGEQATAHFRKFGYPEDMSVTFSGSTWKSFHIYADTVIDTIKAEFPSFTLITPKLEPVAGAVAHLYMEAHKGENTDQFLIENYSKK